MAKKLSRLSTPIIVVIKGLFEMIIFFK